jgi:hypothetical protein
MKITKTTIAMIALIIWAVFSVGYIGWNTWINFKMTKMQQAFTQGQQQTVLAIANEAAKCTQNGVTMNLGNDKDGKPQSMTVVSVDCLKQANVQAPASTPAPVAPKK